MYINIYIISFTFQRFQQSEALFMCDWWTTWVMDECVSWVEVAVVLWNDCIVYVDDCLLNLNFIILELCGSVEWLIQSILRYQNSPKLNWTKRMVPQSTTLAQQRSTPCTTMHYNLLHPREWSSMIKRMISIWYAVYAYFW